MSSTKVQLGARVPASTRDRSKAAAKKAGLTLNQYVEDVLEAALSNGRAESVAASGERSLARSATSSDPPPRPHGDAPVPVPASAPPPPAPPPAQMAEGKTADSSQEAAPPPGRLPGLS